MNVISPHYRQLRERLAADPKRWLVTGVAGFIGSNLVQDLLELGQVVVGLDNFSTGYRSNIDDALSARPEYAERFTLIEGDIRDLDTCRAACAGVDYVLHHAALGSVPWSIEDPLTTNAVNTSGFVNMLVASKEASVARFVYASSSAVYGDTVEQPQVESRIGRPLSPYAASKSTNETYAVAFQMTYGLPTIGLRYFNVFGRRQDPAGAYAAVIPRWISRLLLDQPCEIFGDGETTRDFCYIANVVEANLLAATVTDPAALAQSYNVACAQSVSLNTLFNLMRVHLSREEPFIAQAEPTYKPFRPGDVRFSQASIDRIRQMLAFAPTHDVEEGLAEAIAWYVQQARTLAAASGV